MLLNFGDDAGTTSPTDTPDDSSLAPPDTASSLLPLGLAALGTALLFLSEDKTKKYAGAGAIAVAGVLTMMKKQKVESPVTASATAPVNKDKLVAALPAEAQSYVDVILQVAQEKDIDPLLIAAIGSVETNWATGPDYTPKGNPRGTGDAGHGHGIMQIDDRTWGPDETGVGKGDGWLGSNDWGDPATNISKACDILLADLVYFDDKGLTGDDKLQAALSAYNAGPGHVWKAIQAGSTPDSVTTNGNYALKVTSRYNSYVGAFAASMGQTGSESQVADWGGGTNAGEDSSGGSSDDTSAT